MNNSDLKSEINTDYDIMIVGGGPAGLSTWQHLHKYNPKIAEKSVLIEKEKYPRDKVCGGALGGWTEGVLHKLEIKIDVPSFFIDTIECRQGGEKQIISHKNLFRIIHRKEFDHAFAKDAIQKGLQLHEQEVFLDYSRKDQALLVKTNRGIYKVKVLVGADGALSTVRKRILPNKNPVYAPGLEVIVQVNNDNTEHTEKKAVLDFTPMISGLQGYIWHFPFYHYKKPAINYGIIDFNTTPHKERMNLKKTLLTHINKSNNELNNVIIKSHIIPWFRGTTKLSQPNILLVGDAAGIDPAIGGGIHLSLSYGKIAARAISEHINKKCTFKDYNTRLEQDMLGIYLQQLKKLSYSMYSNPSQTLNIAKKIFTNNI